MGVSWSITRARAGKPVSRLRRGSVEFYIFPDSALCSAVRRAYRRGLRSSRVPERKKDETVRLLSEGLIACAPARAAGSRTLERTLETHPTAPGATRRARRAQDPCTGECCALSVGPGAPLLRASPGIAERRTGRSHGARAQLVGSNGGRQHVRSTTSSIRASGVPWRKSLSPR
jgi:hypothetical protein